MGSAAVGTDSETGYALLQEEPVVVEDLRTETRFEVPALVHEHGVMSGMSVVIHGQDEPFGVLCAHAKRCRTFSEDDMNFRAHGGQRPRFEHA